MSVREGYVVIEAEVGVMQLLAGSYELTDAISYLEDEKEENRLPP